MKKREATESPKLLAKINKGKMEKKGKSKWYLNQKD